MKYLYLILILPILIFGQYSNNLIVNGDLTAWTDDNPDSYTNPYTEDANDYITEVSGAARILRTDGNMRMQQATALTGANGSVVFSYSIDVTAAVSGTLLMYIGAGNYVSLSAVQTYSGITTPPNADFYIYANAPLDITVDNIVIRRRLITLYIDDATGNDANIGDATHQIKTIDECDTRGYYSGGTVNIAAGTYAEDWDIGDDITITATGTAFTIDQIDFGSNTVSCDYYVYNGATTVLNDENVTITNTPVTEEQKGYKHNFGFDNYIERH